MRQLSYCIFIFTKYKLNN